MLSKKQKYEKAIDAKKKLIKYLNKQGIKNPGVGLRPQNDIWVLKVHLSEPMPPQLNISQYEGMDVEIENTGEAFAYNI